jgi:isopenicillin N synthase-like dioxygenase
MVSLGHRVLEAFALALDLPSNYFKSMCQKPMVTMRLLHYPPQSIVVHEDQLGCGAHTDYECFTLLSQSNQSGLQVLNNKGEWIDASPIPHTFVVNIGDLMQRWTNDQFKSTVHRVINTSGTTRYSIPVFFGPDYFAQIKCLTNNQTAKYEPVIAGEYLTQRFDDTYSYRQKDSSSSM